VEVRTYTDLWKWDRKLYAVQDFVLPIPVGLVQAGTAAVVALAWVPLANSLGLTSLFWWAGAYASGMNAIILAGPPILAGWASSRPLIESRTLAQHLLAAARYQLLPTRLVRMDLPTDSPQRAHVTCEVWTPKDGQR